MLNILATASAVALVLLVRVLNGYWKARASVANYPGSRTLFGSLGLMAAALQFILPPRIATHLEFLTPPSFIKNHYGAFEEANSDVITIISALPSAKIVIALADAEVIKDVTSSRARFPKPVHLYGILALFGENIVTSEGGQWKNHRKITAPAFSDRNNKLVWDETAAIVTDMFETIWKDQDSITVENCTEMTLQITMFVMGVAGFGKKMSWTAERTLPPGHEMTFQEALHVACTGAAMKLFLPPWVGRFSAKLQRIFLAFDELEKYMFEMIEERQKGDMNITGKDLLSSLLEANDGESESRLSRREVMGNIFVFQSAGLETTAHTLAFTFGLLALFQEEQEILFKHIMSIIPDGRIPSYSEMPLFTQSMAVFYEALRMFPPPTNIPKQSAEDTFFTTTNAAGVTTTVPVPKGTIVSINAQGLHYNPRYWPDPHAFKPSRFLEDWPRDAFLPFSAGARSCIGRKFAETKGVITLTMIISRYKITVKEEAQFAKETFEERKARVLEAIDSELIPLTPKRVPLVFTRR